MVRKAYAMEKFGCNNKRKITAALVVRRHTCLGKVKDHTKLKMKRVLM